MKHYVGNANPMRPRFEATAAYEARHFSWHCNGPVGTITLNRPQRKNPLSFDSYAELCGLFDALRRSVDVKAVVVARVVKLAVVAKVVKVARAVRVGAVPACPVASRGL